MNEIGLNGTLKYSAAASISAGEATGRSDGNLAHDQLRNSVRHRCKNGQATAVIAVLGTALVLATVPGAEKASALDGEEDAFLGLINNYRAQNGLAPLSVDPALNNVARWMANDMAAYNYFGHTDSQGRDPFTRMDQLGYPFQTWRERTSARNGRGGPSVPDVARLARPQREYAGRQLRIHWHCPSLQPFVCLVGTGRPSLVASTRLPRRRRRLRRLLLLLPHRPRHPPGSDSARTRAGSRTSTRAIHSGPRSRAGTAPASSSPAPTEVHTPAPTPQPPTEYVSDGPFWWGLDSASGGSASETSWVGWLTKNASGWD